MGKGNSGTRSVDKSHSSIIERLKESKDVWISAGMNRYDEEKNNPRYDYSDMAALSEADKTYLVAYLSHSYDTINSALRSDEPMNEEVKQMVKGIDKAIDKLTPYEGTVYRGVTIYTGYRNTDRRTTAELLNYYKSNVGQTITEKQYISTGVTRSKIDRKFGTSRDAGQSLHFTIDSKTRRNLTHYNNEEDEVLFKRGTRFLVVSVRGNNIHLREV